MFQGKVDKLKAQMQNMRCSLLTKVSGKGGLIEMGKFEQYW